MSGRGFATRAIHAGLEADPHTGAIIPPVTLATTYKKDYGHELEVNNQVMGVPTAIDILVLQRDTAILDLIIQIDPTLKQLLLLLKELPMQQHFHQAWL